MPHAPENTSTSEPVLSEPRQAPTDSPDSVQQFIRGQGTVGSQVGRASIKYGGNVVLKFLVFGVLCIGGVGGLFLGEKLFPRNDTAQFACAAVLGAVPAGLLWWIGKKLLAKWSTPR